MLIIVTSLSIAQISTSLSNVDSTMVFAKQVILFGIMILTVIIAQIFNSWTKSQENESISMSTDHALNLVGCAPTKAVFYYDLGGTNCVSSKSWSIIENVEKIFTGFAFNFPHGFDAFHFQIFLNKPLYIFLAIFVNEFIEEFLILVTGKWGFSLDPYSDLEPRYDSLIRDLLHVHLG